MRMREPV
jgi:hypothetical protein